MQSKMGMKLPFFKEVLQRFFKVRSSPYLRRNLGIFSLSLSLIPRMQDGKPSIVAHLMGKDLVICAYKHTHTNKMNARLCVLVFIHCTLVKDHDHDDLYLLIRAVSTQPHYDLQMGEYINRPVYVWPVNTVFSSVCSQDDVIMSVTLTNYRLYSLGASCQKD